MRHPKKAEHDFGRTRLNVIYTYKAKLRIKIAKQLDKEEV